MPLRKVTWGGTGGMSEGRIGCNETGVGAGVGVGVGAGRACGCDGGTVAWRRTGGCMVRVCGLAATPVVICACWAAQKGDTAAKTNVNREQCFIDRFKQSRPVAEELRMILLPMFVERVGKGFLHRRGLTK